VYIHKLAYNEKCIVVISAQCQCQHVSLANNVVTNGSMLMHSTETPKHVLCNTDTAEWYQKVQY
jgi:hypothetical protein